MIFPMFRLLIHSFWFTKPSKLRISSRLAELFFLLCFFEFKLLFAPPDVSGFSGTRRLVSSRKIGSNRSLLRYMSEMDYSKGSRRG